MERPLKAAKAESDPVAAADRAAVAAAFRETSTKTSEEKPRVRLNGDDKAPQTSLDLGPIQN